MMTTLSNGQRQKVKDFGNIEQLQSDKKPDIHKVDLCNQLQIAKIYIVLRLNQQIGNQQKRRAINLLCCLSSIFLHFANREATVTNLSYL